MGNSEFFFNSAAILDLKLNLYTNYIKFIINNPENPLTHSFRDIKSWPPYWVRLNPYWSRPGLVGSMLAYKDISPGFNSQKKKYVFRWLPFRRLCLWEFYNILNFQQRFALNIEAYAKHNCLAKTSIHKRHLFMCRVYLMYYEIIQIVCSQKYENVMWICRKPCLKYNIRIITFFTIQWSHSHLKLLVPSIWNDSNWIFQSKRYNKDSLFVFLAKAGMQRFIYYTYNYS